jgi:hypothetical protein
VLQLSGQRAVVLLDMLALGAQCPADLAAALRAILIDCRGGGGDTTSGGGGGGGPPVVLGFGVAEDLRRLVSTHPGPVAEAVLAVPRVLCLQALAARTSAARGWGSTPGLSGVCAGVLGLPLDKTEVCGDWAGAYTRFQLNLSHF